MKTWFCKIGEAEEVPHEVEVRDTSQLSVRRISADQHMRRAVEAAYEALTGEKCTFDFSGWGDELDECERAVVEDREPDYFKTGWLEKRLHELRAHFRRDEPLPEWTPEQWVTTPMMKLGEAAYYLHEGIEGSTRQRLSDSDLRLGVECLMATAAACLDAVEALESHGEEAPAEQAATG